MMLTLLGLLVVSGAWGYEWADSGLEGLPEPVQVLIRDVDATAAARTGITKEWLEATLRAALVKEEWSLVSAAAAGEEPVIYLGASLMPLNDGTTVYVLDLVVRDKVLLARGTAEEPIWLWVWANVWTATGALGSRLDYEMKAHLTERITEMVSELDTEWLAANFFF